MEAMGTGNVGEVMGKGSLYSDQCRDKFWRPRKNLSKCYFGEWGDSREPRKRKPER